MLYDEAHLSARHMTTGPILISQIIRGVYKNRYGTNLLGLGSSGIGLQHVDGWVFNDAV
jgi:hypothetical protein